MIDMNGQGGQIRRTSQGEKSEGVGSTRDGTRDRRTRFGERTQLETPTDVGVTLPLGIERRADGQPSE